MYTRRQKVIEFDGGLFERALNGKLKLFSLLKTLILEYPVYYERI